MTAIASIVGAIVAALSAGTPVSAHIFRARVRPVPDEATNAVAVRPVSALPDRSDIGGAPVDFTTNIAVECYARSATTSPDLAVDALLESVYARLMADASLGGLVMDLNLTGIDFNFDADALQSGSATLTFAVRHRTSSTTLT